MCQNLKKSLYLSQNVIQAVSFAKKNEIIKDH